MSNITDPVDTDALRGAAKVLFKRGAIARTFGDESDIEDADIDQDVSRMLRAAADEVDRLRALVASRPHDDLCAVWSISGGTSDGGCTCWKADAL